jgi:hypothetical protein
MLPSKQDELGIVKIATAMIDRVPVRDNTSATAPAPESVRGDTKKC